ncbi:hypothetical protein ACLK1S_02360 [Escherichia coli]
MCPIIGSSGTAWRSVTSTGRKAINVYYGVEKLTPIFSSVEAKRMALLQMLCGPFDMTEPILASSP